MTDISLARQPRKLRANESMSPRGKITTLKQWAIIYCGTPVSLHTTSQACIAKLKSMKYYAWYRNQIGCLGFNHEQICAMHFEFKREGWSKLKAQ